MPSIHNLNYSNTNLISIISSPPKPLYQNYSTVYNKNQDDNKSLISHLTSPYYVSLTYPANSKLHPSSSHKPLELR